MPGSMTIGAELPCWDSSLVRIDGSRPLTVSDEKEIGCVQPKACELLHSAESCFRSQLLCIYDADRDASAAAAPLDR
jgi:hypothetical protein